MKRKVVVKLVKGQTHVFENVQSIDKQNDLILTLEDGSQFVKPFSEIERVSISDISESKQEING